jgi:glutamine amidotransferase
MAESVITIVDYQAGNLGSVVRAIRELGAKAEISSDPQAVRQAERLLLPGVGSFRVAMQALRAKGLDQAIRQFAVSGRPFLGICLGLQLLATCGEEDGEAAGLGLLPGRVVRLQGQVKIPHVGWNQVYPSAAAAGLFQGIQPGEWFYFVHSYCFAPTSPLPFVASTEHGQVFPAAVGSQNLWGVQFHPEKSGDAGRRLLQNFIQWKE